MFLWSVRCSTQYSLNVVPQSRTIIISPASTITEVCKSSWSHDLIPLKIIPYTSVAHNCTMNYLAKKHGFNCFAISVFSHTKHSQINNLRIFTIVFHFRHTLFLHDLLIHSFYPFHMSDHHLAKGLSLSLVHDFGIPYLLTPEIRILYQLSVPGSKRTSSKLHSLPRLFPISLDCLPGFWFLLFSFYALSNDT